MVDCIGNEIQRGDTLVFASKSGSSPSMLRVAVVLELSGDDADENWVKAITGGMEYNSCFRVGENAVKLTNSHGIMLMRSIDLERMKQFMLAVTGKRLESRGVKTLTRE